MSRLLDALMQRFRAPPAPRAAPQMTIGQHPMDVTDLSKLHHVLMDTPPEIFDSTKFPDRSGSYAPGRIGPDPKYGGFTVPRDAAKISLADNLMLDEDALRGTYGHELGHALDLGRVDKLLPDPTYDSITHFSPDQLKTWGRDALKLGRSGTDDFVNAITQESGDYRLRYARPGMEAVLRRSPNGSEAKWFNDPAEHTADMFRDYLDTPNSFKNLAPLTHQYLRDRMMADPFWEGKLDFKTVGPFAVGTGLAGFDALDQEKSNGTSP